MISFVLLVCCLGGLVSSAPGKVYEPDDAETHFEDFMNTYNKNYSSEEDKKMRFEIFKNNLKKYNEQNMMDDLAEIGITQFSDLTVEEFISMYTGFRKPEGQSPCAQAPALGTNHTAPEEYDWRQQNKVTRVKEQGSCKSCWAFSVVGNVEGQYAIKHNDLREFSEMQLVNCDKRSSGCTGGYPTLAIRYIQSTNGLMGESDYPYTPADASCSYDGSKAQVQVTNCFSYTSLTEDDLKEILYTTGPLSVTIDATNIHGYKEGIRSCQKETGNNHAVLLVGYGTENGVPYWLIKNSWGTGYGEQGYIRVRRNANACCGLMDPDGTIVSAVVA